MKFVASIEARMGSTRTPGKTLIDIAGKPLLQRVIDRFLLCNNIDEIIVATTTNPKDDELVDYCKDHGIKYYRGSEDDVMQRVTDAVDSVSGDVVVEQGADNPFVDPSVVDKLVEIFRSGNYDFVSSALKLTYPLGVYAHLFSLDLLKRIAKITKEQRDRENVSNYIWERPEEFKLFNLEAPQQLTRPQYRLTVDYPEDIELARILYKNLSQKFALHEVVAFLDSHPEIAGLNKDKIQKASSHINVRKEDDHSGA